MMINRKKKLSLMIALLSLACTGLEGAERLERHMGYRSGIYGEG